MNTLDHAASGKLDIADAHSEHGSVPEISPCPFCGSTMPFTYISFNTVVLECDCGVKVKSGAACVMYKREALPAELKAFAYEPTGLVIRSGGTDIPYPDHGYIGVSAIAALQHSGALAIWNRRAGT